MRPAHLLPKHDGVTRAAIIAYDERLAIYDRDGGRCRACGEPVAFDAFELAHRIANTVCNARRFGRHVIDHPLNKAAAHPGRCNSRMNCGTDPMACAALILEIKEAEL